MGRSGRRDARSIVAGLLLLAGLLGVALPAAADPRDKLEKIQARKEKAAQQAELYAAKRSDVLARIRVIDRKRAKVETKVDDLDQRLAILDSNLNRVKDRLEAAQQKVALLTDELQGVLGDLSQSTDEFTARAVEAYKGGSAVYFESVLGSSSFSDLVDRMEYWEAALDSDAELISTIQLLRDETEDRREVIIEKQAEIVEAKKQLEKDRKAVAAVRAEHNAVLETRQALLSEKQGLLAEVERKKAYWEALEDQLEDDAAEIRSLLSSSGTSGTPPTAGGQFLWPTNGPMTSPYGYRTHPIFGDRRLHTGIDIGAGYGNAVYAADTGTVSYVGTMSGYGNVVIVDHGSGLATTYNHLSAFNVSSGATVQRGTTVGAVGCTGYCTGPHLHFEVRVNGGPVDPMPYLQ